MQKKQLLLFSLAALLICLAGCRNQTPLIKYSKLPAIAQKNNYYQKKSNIGLTARVLTFDESKAYFGVDLISYGYTPIQIKIENESNDTLVIRPSYIGLPLAEPQNIAKLMHWDTYSYVSITGILTAMFFWPALFWVGRNGYDMYSDNKKTNEAVNSVSLDQNAIVKIHPYDDFNKIIFIDRNLFLPNFNIKLFNKEQKKLICFNVSL